MLNFQEGDPKMKRASERRTLQQESTGIFFHPLAMKHFAQEEQK